MIPSFFDFLESKPLYYKAIDHERIHRAYDSIRGDFAHPPVIHIVGTNGKGSTGRMIAHLVRSSGMEDGKGVKNSQLSVGHYSSPHILRFNERIWIDGEEVSDEALEEAHRRLYSLLGRQISEALSYFEYTTLLALLLFERCDLIVLEAGLGGEYDATNVAENKLLTVVTPIGIDHQAFLGETIEEIAATKLRSIAPGAKVLLSPQPYDEVVPIAKQIVDERKAKLQIMDNSELQNPIFDILRKEKGWPGFLLENARTALQALEIIGIEADPEGLKDLELFGRYYPVAENIRIDVGHNPLAARAITQVMEPETVLIYNALSDKDFSQVLRTFLPKLKRVELLPIPGERSASMEEIEAVLEDLEIPWSLFDGQLFSHEHYLVFGSFYTVEAFLKRFMLHKSVN